MDSGRVMQVKYITGGLANARSVDLLAGLGYHRVCGLFKAIRSEQGSYPHSLNPQT